jgi:ArsR family metal-binding transcriptional regulator
LNENVGKVLPYLNANLGGNQYLTNPPEVMFHHQGKIIKVGEKEIAINALKDEQEADCILEWLKKEINQAWENRAKITPCTTGKSKPKLMEILQLLPKTNCQKCGSPTCMAFAAVVMDGGLGAEHCTAMNDESKMKLSAYLAGFIFE